MGQGVCSLGYRYLSILEGSGFFDKVVRAGDWGSVGGLGSQQWIQVPSPGIPKMVMVPSQALGHWG